ncbi:hypothetical protein [Pokkaliibacter plantistimulans]|uniref:hypothetical protein n=1 Tax=Pokkaliibacter plantistimulans TaxID=1635171 RepID=UPI0039902569
MKTMHYRRRVCGLLLAVLGSTLSLSACAIPTDISIQQGGDSQDATYDSCKAFSLTAKQVAEYFQTADPVEDSEWHGRAVIAPCYVEGMMSVGGRQYHWRITASGSGYRYLPDSEGQQRYFICDETSQHMSCNRLFEQ